MPSDCIQNNSDPLMSLRNKGMQIGDNCTKNIIRRSRIRSLLTYFCSYGRFCLTILRMKIFSNFLSGEEYKFGKNSENGLKALLNKQVIQQFADWLRPSPYKGSSGIADNMIILMVYRLNLKFNMLNLNDILFNQSIICRKVLFSMYYVIFR